MKPKTFYLKNIIISLIGIVFVLFLLYLENKGMFVPGIRPITSRLIVLENTIYKQFTSIKNTLSSIGAATEYKNKYLNCIAELDTCNYNLNQQNNSKQPETFKKLSVLVINWPETGFIVLNHGKDMHIKPGDIVVTKHNVLVGKVTKVYSGLSIVHTIFKPGLKFSVYAKSAKAPGLIQFTPNYAILDNIPITYNLSIHDKVYLLEYYLPKNIYVGTITNVTKNDANAFYVATIKYPYTIHTLKSLELKIIKPNYETTK